MNATQTMSVENTIGTRNNHSRHGSGNNLNRCASKPLILDGCTVYIHSSTKNTDEPLRVVKEILMSAYRTRNTKLPSQFL